MIQPAPALQAWRDLDLEMQTQSQPLWCWLATSVSIARFYDPKSDWTQCSLANALLGKNNCCKDEDACNFPGKPNVALEKVKHLKEKIFRALDLDELMAEIDAGNPVSISIRIDLLKGHNVVIDGYQLGVDGEPTMVSIKDPEHGSYVCAFDDFPGNCFPGSTWYLSYLTK